MTHKYYKHKFTLAILLSLISNFCCAQYFVSEIDPFNLKWKKISDKTKGDIVFPDYMLDKALRISLYRDTLSKHIFYNIPFRDGKFPVSIHPTNILSNGMVTYTPRRMELYTMPLRDNYSVPWLKQLIAHEYRHVAQLSNLNQGFIKGLSYVIGEQALGISAIQMPTYYYEGDAVAAETQLSVWGRGRQPSFTTPLRAELLENKKINIKRFRYGSINHYTPGSYLLGYFVTQYATKEYGNDFWSQVLRYTARNPYFINPKLFAYRKYGNGTNSNKLITESMTEIANFWRENSQNNNSSDIIVEADCYSEYETLMALSDRYIIAHKSNYNEARHFVLIDVDSGVEQVLRYTGYLTSRPTIIGDKVYWTEVVPSLSWGQKNSSSLFSMRIKIDGNKVRATKPRVEKEVKDNIFLFSAYKNGNYVAVTYDQENNPSVVVYDMNFKKKKVFSMGEDIDISFNGLCYDNKSNMLFAAIVNNNGTSVVEIDLESNKVTYVIAPSYNTITSLTAYDGKLYFTSINSGKEEAHVFDPHSKKEYRITDSKYGSRASGVNPSNGNMLLTTYTAKGYLAAQQKIDSSKLISCQWQRVPDGKLDYKFEAWNVPKLDTINISSKQIIEYGKKSRVAKYNKALKAIDVHSWMPFYLNTNKLIDDRELLGGLGINLLSQNLLNSVVANFGYGWVNGSNMVTANVTYKGLPVEIKADFEYGGGEQQAYNFIYLGADLKQYLRVGGELSLPLNLSSGTNNRFFRATLFSYYHNHLVYNKIGKAPTVNLFDSWVNGNTFSTSTQYVDYTISEGIVKSGLALSFQNYKKIAKKELNPRYGYAVQFNTTFSPTNSDFAKEFMLYGKLYLPAPLQHGSLTLEAAYHTQTNAELSFNQSILFPKGATRYYGMQDINSYAIDYRVPLCYPNIGGSLLYFQRLSAAIFAGYSQYEFKGINRKFRSNSFGGTLFFDVNFIGITNIINCGLSIFKPSDKNAPSFDISFKIDI